jgi:hypothetical protein
MKTPEDEAFDDLAQRQMAADKLQQPAPNKKRPIESDYTSYVAYTRALERLCDTLLAQPAQEPVAWHERPEVLAIDDDGDWTQDKQDVVDKAKVDEISELRKLIKAQAKPVQEPVARAVQGDA